VRLRNKVMLAQLPLVIALGITIAIGSYVTRSIGHGSELILKDNYRSVLAAERMKEAAERIDSGVVFTVIGRANRGSGQIDTNLVKLESELTVQEANITEPGEREATQKLRAAWNTYRTSVAGVRDHGALEDKYFTEMLPQFLAVKDSADTILAMNQDAMIQKSDSARRLGQSSRTFLAFVSLFGLMLAIAASSLITSRVLRPLSVLGQTARRLGEGDVAVRARIESKDEIGELGAELNTMAERIQKYRQSSLGDLVEAQLAAQATIDSLPDPVLVVSLAGELRHANQAAEAILKVRTDAGSGALAALDPVVRATVERLLQHVATGRGAYVPKGLDEAIELGGDGPQPLLLPRVAPLYAEEGNVVGATIVFQDVTRLHRFEELRDDVVATVAHELRTPLTSLRMAVHLLAENVVGELNAKQTDLVQAAREECDRLQSIVDELLDLSRIHADRIELRIEARDPEELVNEAIAAQHSLAEERGVTIRSEVLPGTAHVAVDRERILLVFANLIGNALRYGPAKGTVTVRALVRDNMMRFEVSDQGEGVPQDYRGTIFDKYVRVPESPAGGAGLGLFISREIVRAHGGEIGIDDGATFWFTTKLAQVS
jgi:two-component system, NtrC family, sensor histidine kinase KinB